MIFDCNPVILSLTFLTAERSKKTLSGFQVRRLRQRSVSVADLTAPVKTGEVIPITLNLMPASSDAVYSIHAVVKNNETGKWQQAGRFDVLSRTPKTYSVTLVPMGGGVPVASTIETELNNVWRPYGISWTVNVEPAFYNINAADAASKARVTLIDGIIGTGLITGDKWPSEYSPQQKAINIAYRDYALAKNYHKETMYVFVLPTGKAPSNEQVGDMPLGKQWGYLYCDAVDTRTLAHELGQGKTILQHTFRSEAEKGTTQNLMDYSTGTDLVRQQWAAIHDPAVFDPRQSDEDGAAIDFEAYYLSPNGKPIYLPASVTKICFVEDNINCPRGALKEFIINGQRYSIDIPAPDGGSPHSVSFGGYKNKNNETYDDKKTYAANQIINARKGYLVGTIYKPTYTVTEGDYKIQSAYPPSTISDADLNKNFTFTQSIIENQPCHVCNEPGSIIDYSTGSDGKSFLTQAEKDKLNVQINSLSTAMGGQYKLYLINKTNPKAAEARANAAKEPSGTTGKIEYDGSTNSIDVKLDFKFPDWFSDFPVNATCGKTIVDQAIEELHRSSIYTGSSILNKILLEIGILTYKGFWANIQCTLSEEACSGNNQATQFLAGATFEFISIFNVEELLKGIYQLGSGTVTLVSDSYIGYFKDIASIYKGAKAGTYNGITQNDFLTLYNKLTPPGMRAYDSAINQIYSVSKTLFNFYIEDVPTKYWRYGQLTTMIVPVIVTAGEWALEKGATIAAKYTAKYGAKAKDITTIVNDGIRLEATVVKDGERLLVKEAEDATDNITVIEKNNITGEQNLPDIIDVGDLKKLNTTDIENGGVIEATAGNKTDGWNKELNKTTLQPNTTYKANNYLYETDAEGRVAKVSGELKDNVNDRNKYQQTSCVKKKGGIPGSDEGGHLIASIFKGPGEQINLLPMNGNINKSAWKIMENGWANKLKEGKTVNVEIQIIFEGSSKRPIKFKVFSEIDGIEEMKSFDNL